MAALVQPLLLRALGVYVPLGARAFACPDGSSGSGLVHHKFLMIDQTKVITGSFNWSPSAAQPNDETLLVIHSPQLARITPRIQRKLNRQKIHCGDGVERG